MGETADSILEATIRVFMRYGVRRTTMNDIAVEAGLARQTLYSVFANKDEILCACIRHFSNDTLNAITRDWQDQTDLGGKLDVFFEHAILASFRLLRASPDARDMADGYNAAGKAAIRQVQSEKVAHLASMLEQYKTAIAQFGFNSEQVADFLLTAALAARDSADDEQRLLSLLSVLKSSVLALSGEQG